VEENKFCAECGTKLFNEVEKEHQIDHEEDGSSIISEYQESANVIVENDLNPNDAQEYSRKENFFSKFLSKIKPIIKNQKFKYIACAIVIVFILAGIIGYYQYEKYKENQFNVNVAKAEKYFNNDDFDKAKEYFETALRFQEDQKINEKMQLSIEMGESKNLFDSGNNFFDKKDYYLAYYAFDKVIAEDEKRFTLASAKKAECSKFYIDRKLSEAKENANEGNYLLAISCLNEITNFDSTNETAKTLRKQYQAKQDALLDEEKARIEQERRAKEAAEAKALAKTQGVSIGMTQQQVLDSSWGRPTDINKTITEYGTHEQWVYNGYNYLYFEDGILTSIQN
jgi:hypothetical protein